jgi:E3 ubiquitin-protein ligase DOA10
MDDDQGMITLGFYFTVQLLIKTSTEICRVCRSESTPDHPLYHPCKCSGSIRFVHEDW